MSLIGKEGAEDPLINGGSVSLFSYGDEFSDECLSPKLQLVVSIVHDHCPYSITSQAKLSNGLSFHSLFKMT
ncbi:unnamed protein product, partial [Nesidiocoris tenuis]